MKADDPRLEASRKAMEERVKKFNELMLAVVKGHLVIEQAMDGFLSASFSHPEHVQDGKVARFTHSQKVQMCRATSFNEAENGLWKVIWAVNTLRNQIAHDLDVAEIQRKMNNVRKELFANLTEKQVAALKAQSDDYIAQYACVLCAGFLGMLQDDAEDRRKVIDEHWRP
jgi:hypothetical protein